MLAARVHAQCTYECAAREEVRSSGRADVQEAGARKMSSPMARASERANSDKSRCYPFPRITTRALGLGPGQHVGHFLRPTREVFEMLTAWTESTRHT